MRLFIPVCLVLVAGASRPAPAQTQTDSAAIAAVIGDYARGWREADIPLLRQVFDRGGAVVWPGGPARDTLNSMTFEDLLARRRPRPHFGHRWEIRSLAIVEGTAAVVTVWFEDEPRASIDLLTLYKLGDRWRIVSKTFVIAER